MICAALVAAVSGCGSDSDQAASPDRAGEAADTGVCRSEASPVDAPYGDAFPSDWPFPPQTTVFDVEDRGADGTIVTGVSSADFEAILDHMNHQVVDAGFEIESGETEEHDAEAEWAGNGYRGRWAIRESSQCPGETVVQVLSTAG